MSTKRTINEINSYFNQNRGGSMGRMGGNRDSHTTFRSNNYKMCTNSLKNLWGGESHIFF